MLVYTGGESEVSSGARADRDEIDVGSVFTSGPAASIFLEAGIMELG
jgi:hypothetical protein